MLHDFNLTYYSSIILGSFSIPLFPKLCCILASPLIVGAKYISQLLNVTHTLQELNIGSNNIGDDGIAVISEALQQNKSFTTLNVLKCGLSAKGTVHSV